MKEKYYDDPKENAAFLRHVDVVTNMILKYGPALNVIQHPWCPKSFLYQSN